MIKLCNVNKNYIMGNNTIRALNNVNFEISQGDFAVVLGPSGSGKTTLLNLLGGMDKVTDGEILVDGMMVSGFGNKELVQYRRKIVGFVFQFYNLIPNLTAMENIAVASRLGDNPISPAEVLDAVGLLERKSHFPGELSGGEMQRISIARAICKNPKLLLCDEPTGALDSKTGKIILALLQKMSKEYNKTVIVVTHNASLAQIASCVIELKDGEVENYSVNKHPAGLEEVEW